MNDLSHGTRLDCRDPGARREFRAVVVLVCVVLFAVLGVVLVVVL